jgi:hypothetical protein
MHTVLCRTDSGMAGEEPLDKEAGLRLTANGGGEGTACAFERCSSVRGSINSNLSSERFQQVGAGAGSGGECSAVTRWQLCSQTLARIHESRTQFSGFEPFAEGRNKRDEYKGVGVREGDLALGGELVLGCWLPDHLRSHNALAANERFRLEHGQVCSHGVIGNAEPGGNRVYCTVAATDTVDDSQSGWGDEAVALRHEKNLTNLPISQQYS